MTRSRTLLAVTAIGVLLPGAGGDAYRWQRSLEVIPGWNVLELPDDLLAASRPGLPDLRLVGTGAGLEEDVPYAFQAGVGPSAQAIELRDVETSPLRQTIAIVDRGSKPGAGRSMHVSVAGSQPFLKPVVVEASDDRGTWREIAKGSIFRAEGAEMSTLRFAPNDRRYWRLRLDDRNGEPIHPVSVLVPRPADALPVRRVPVALARAPSDAPGVSAFTVTLPSKHMPVQGLVLVARDAAFERHVRVYERVVFRDEVSRRLVGESTVFRSADAREAGEVSLADALSSVLEVEIVDGDSPALDLTEASVIVASPTIVFFAREGIALSLRYGSETASAPRYDLDAALARGRPDSLHEARVRDAIDRGPPTAPRPPAPPGPKLDASAWSVRRPIALPNDGSVAYVDLNPPEVPGARIVDADGRQVPYILETAPHHVRRPAEVLERARAQTTELEVRNIAPGELVDLLELHATGPDYFERSVAVSEKIWDDRGPIGLRELGGAAWKKRPGEPFVPLRVPLQAPHGAELLVHIDDGDNPPLTLGPAALEIEVRRIEFVFQPAQQLALLTGNPEAGAPRYDLALLAPVLLAAPAQAATLGATSGKPSPPPPTPRWFWLALAAGGALVIVVLLRALKPMEGPTSRAP